MISNEAAALEAPTAARQRLPFLCRRLQESSPAACGKDMGRSARSFGRPRAARQCARWVRTRAARAPMVRLVGLSTRRHGSPREPCRLCAARVALKFAARDVFVRVCSNPLSIAAALEQRAPTSTQHGPAQATREAATASSVFSSGRPVCAPQSAFDFLPTFPQT